MLCFIIINSSKQLEKSPNFTQSVWNRLKKRFNLFKEKFLSAGIIHYWSENVPTDPKNVPIDYLKVPIKLKKKVPIYFKKFPLTPTVWEIFQELKKSFYQLERSPNEDIPPSK